MKGGMYFAAAIILTTWFNTLKSHTCVSIRYSSKVAKPLFIGCVLNDDNLLRCQLFLVLFSLRPAVSNWWSVWVVGERGLGQNSHKTMNRWTKELLWWYIQDDLQASTSCFKLAEGGFESRRKIIAVNLIHKLSVPVDHAYISFSPWKWFESTQRLLEILQ